MIKWRHGKLRNFTWGYKGKELAEGSLEVGGLTPESEHRRAHHVLGTGGCLGSLPELHTQLVLRGREPWVREETPVNRQRNSVSSIFKHLRDSSQSLSLCLQLPCYFNLLFFLLFFKRLLLGFDIHNTKTNCIVRKKEGTHTKKHWSVKGERICYEWGLNTRNLESPTFLLKHPDLFS